MPIIISGATVSRKNKKENSLINTTDLLTTIAEVSGISVTEIYDSKSFKTLSQNNTLAYREFVYSETSEEKTSRNNTYKYLVFDNGEEFFSTYLIILWKTQTF